VALDKTRLKNNLKTMYQDMEVNGGNSREDQLDYFCEKLADVLVEEIKNLKVNYTNGLTAGSTPVAGLLNHTVS
jgi:aspartyl/asparaginyl-tRNA synthetase